MVYDLSSVWQDRGEGFQRAEPVGRPCHSGRGGEGDAGAASKDQARSDFGWRLWWACGFELNLGGPISGDSLREQLLWPFVFFEAVAEGVREILRRNILNTVGFGPATGRVRDAKLIRQSAIALAETLEACRRLFLVDARAGGLSSPRSSRRPSCRAPTRPLKGLLGVFWRCWRWVWPSSWAATAGFCAAASGDPIGRH